MGDTAALKLPRTALGITLSSVKTALLTLWLSLALTQLHAAENRAAQLRTISRQYAQAEGGLARAVHALYVYEESGATVTQQVWMTQARDILKASEERKSAAGRELTEYFPGIDEEPAFVLHRREAPQPGGGVQVEEERRYYAEGNLIQCLTKKAAFAAGEPADTVKTKNTAVPADQLSAVAQDGPIAWRSADGLIATVLKRGKTDRDPAAGPPGDSARYRLIQQTCSPDGRFALGFGMAREPVPWAKLADGNLDRTGDPIYFADPDHDTDVCNYLVDLNTHRILGETGVTYLGTRHQFNHFRCYVTWSPRSRWFVQVYEMRWGSHEGVVGWADAETGTLATADLLKPAEERAFAFLKAQKDPAWRKHHEDFAVSTRCLDLEDDGTMLLDVRGEIPKSMEEDSSFHVRLRFRATPSRNRVALKFLEARRGDPL